MPSTSAESSDVPWALTRLRLAGLNQHVKLPEILLFGDDNIKSAVWESIGIRRGDDLNSKSPSFLIELITEPDTVSSITVSIVPCGQRSTQQRIRLQAYNREFAAEPTPTLSHLLKGAKAELGEPLADYFLLEDVVRIEKRGPGLPHLAIIDFPFDAPASAPSEKTRCMMAERISSQESIILAFFSSQSFHDMHNAFYRTRASSPYRQGPDCFPVWSIPNLALEVDPSGSRTIGLIATRDYEAYFYRNDRDYPYLKLVENKEITLAAGWHVFMESEASRNECQAHLENGSLPRPRPSACHEIPSSCWSWGAAEKSKLGMRNFVHRLGEVFKEHSIRHLPHIVSSMDSQVRARTEEQGWRDSMSVPLLSRAKLVSVLAHVTLEGIPKDTPIQQADCEIVSEKEWQRNQSRRDFSIFSPRPAGDGFSCHCLRATLEGRLKQFITKMLEQGRTFLISSNGNPLSGPENFLSRECYVQQVCQIVKRKRGSWPPGFIDPEVIIGLFTEQCRPWQTIVESMLAKIVVDANNAVRVIIKYIASLYSREEISLAIEFEYSYVEKALRRKVDELVAFHTSSQGFELTNPNLIREVQDIRRQRNLRATNSGVVGSSLLQRLAEYDDLDFQASELVVDYMKAHYEFARKRLICDICVAVDNVLLRQLSAMFDPKLGPLANFVEAKPAACDNGKSPAELSVVDEKPTFLRDCALWLSSFGASLETDCSDTESCTTEVMTPTGTSIAADSRRSSYSS